MDVASIDAALEIAVELGAKVALPQNARHGHGRGRRNYGSRRQHLRSLGANQKVDLVLRRTEQVAKMAIPMLYKRPVIQSKAHKSY